MPKEMETGTRTSEPIEILPESIGKIPVLEAAPLLARASSRIHILGWKGEFWDGVRENLEGASAWTKVNKSNLVKKTLSVVTGVSLLTSMVSACTNGPGPVIIPSETDPRITDVSPTATDVVPTSTITLTETPIPTATEKVPPPELLAKLNLNPDRTYTVIDNYYVDSYNGAKLAKLESGQWVVTTLEEKYGHLVLAGETLKFVESKGNFFHDEKGLSDDQDSRYQNISMLVRSSGNITLTQEYNEELGMNVSVIGGDVLYRDANGALNIQNVRFDVFDPTSTLRGVLISLFSEDTIDEFGCTGNVTDVLAVKSLEEEKAIYNEPGKLLCLVFAYERPDYPPKLHREFWYANTTNVANYYFWKADREKYTDFADSIANGTEFEPGSDFVLAAQFVFINRP